MALTALAAESVGEALGIERMEDGLPTRPAVAELVRSILDARGHCRRSDLEQWCATLAAPRLVGSPSLTNRIYTVLEIMLRAGEIGAHDRVDGTIVWLRPQHYVRLAPDREVLLGARESAGEETNRSSPGILRAARPDGDAVGLTVCLGEPDFMAAATAEAGHRVPSLAAFIERIAARDEMIGDFGDYVEVHSRRRQTGVRLALLRGERQGGYILTAEASGTRRAVSVADDTEAGWLSLAIQFPGASLRDDGPGFPAQIRAALALGCEPVADDLVEWTLPDWFSASFAQWLGEPAPELPSVGVGSDDERDRLASGRPDARRVIEAGPGSGKTYLACSRIAALVNEGVSPTRIWVISFTNAAITELRQRIAGFLEDASEARDINIATLDSLAARFRRYGDPAAVDDVRSFDDAIRATTELLRSEARQLKGYLSTTEHLIVDEVQDLTAERNELLLEIIKTLPAGCGVTLFLDSAQAIYGFSNRPGATVVPPLAERILGEPSLSFEAASITGDYRTRSDELRLMKEDLRRKVLRPGVDGRELYSDVREQLEDFAAQSGRTAADLIASHSAMILFRSHSELVSAATRYWEQGQVFRIRLPGGRPVLKAWIASCLSGLRSDEVLTRSHFESLWESLWPRPLGLDVTEAWGTLRSIAADGPADKVSVARAAEQLASASPPGTAISQVMGAGGALLSTIHGVKGREAEHILMVLPKFREFRDGIDWAEEARVLFVGATRARRSLSIASSGRSYAQRLSGRSWSPWREVHARIEIGQDNDVDDLLSVLGSPGEPSERSASRQRTLRELGGKVTKAFARRNVDRRYEMFIGDPGASEKSIGYLSDDFVQSFKGISRKLYSGGAALPATIRGIFCIGVRTVVIPERLGETAVARFGLSPVVLGYPAVFFKPWRGDQPATAAGDA